MRNAELLTSRTALEVVPRAFSSVLVWLGTEKIDRLCHNGGRTGKRTHLIAEVLHHAGNSGRAVDQDETEATLRVIHAKTGQNIGAGPLAHADDVLNAKGVEDLHQTVRDRLHVRELEAALQTRHITPYSYLIVEVLISRTKSSGFHRQLIRFPVRPRRQIMALGSSGKEIINGDKRYGWAMWREPQKWTHKLDIVFPRGRSNTQCHRTRPLPMIVTPYLITEL